MAFHVLNVDRWFLFFRFVAPVEALALMIWWAVDLITSEARNGEKWYEFGTETFITTITQVCVVVYGFLCIDSRLLGF